MLRRKISASCAGGGNRGGYALVPGNTLGRIICASAAGAEEKGFALVPGGRGMSASCKIRKCKKLPFRELFATRKRGEEK